MKRLLILFLIVGLMTFGCTSVVEDTAVENATPEVTKDVDDKSIPASSEYCPNLKIPSHILVERVDRYIVDNTILSIVDWDGWVWYYDSFDEEYDSLYCHKGASEGENVNYQYCSYGSSKLSKSFTDAEGIVVEEVKYDMKWVYAPSGNDYKLKEIQYTEYFGEGRICTVEYD